MTRYGGEKTEADQKAIQEWLKKNKVTVCEPYARTENVQLNHGWGAKKKKTVAKKQVDNTGFICYTVYNKLNKGASDAKLVQ